MNKSGWLLSVALLATAGLLSGCALPTPPGDSGDGTQTDTTDIPTDTSDTPAVSEEALADFAVTDVNATSARYLSAVSPRDYLGQVSAWYFGHST